MCGIAAVFEYGGRRTVDRACLTRVRDCMHNRGPDGEGLWTAQEGHAALAHRRLSIVDLSEAGAQPMHSSDGRVTVSFNGEIYNYPALRRRLERAGHRFQSDCDTEVLLHLYQEKGAALTEDLRGMYAFALWDAERQGLLLARDPYGIKPLYYADDGERLWAASQVEALRKASTRGGRGPDMRPDPAGHVGFFLFGHVPEPHTLFRGIRALPAGHTLWVGEEGPGRPEAFAQVPHLLAEAEREARQSGARQTPNVRERLRDALTSSVQHHLMADVEVGVFLSSGLDSATLAALLAEQGTPLRTITLGFEPYRGQPEDEVPLAEEMAEQFGAHHETVWLGQSDFEEARGAFFAAMDQPTIDGLNTYFVSRAAAEAGLKVALSGLGGDELFGGYPSFRQIPPLVQALRYVPGVQAAGRHLRAVAAPVLKRFTSPKYAGLLEYGGDYGGAYLLRRGLFMPWELPRLLGPDMARAGWEALRPRLRVNATAASPQSARFKVSAMESGWYMRNQLLRDTDWTAMAHALEVRTPLVDVQLLREVAPLLAARPALGKRDMAATPTQPLPENVLNRPKTGFTVPVRQWLADSSGSSSNGHASGQPAGRGLRAWARYVHNRYTRDAGEQDGGKA